MDPVDALPGLLLLVSFILFVILIGVGIAIGTVRD